MIDRMSTGSGLSQNRQFCKNGRDMKSTRQRISHVFLRYESPLTSRPCVISIPQARRTQIAGSGRGANAGDNRVFSKLKLCAAEITSLEVSNRHLKRLTVSRGSNLKFSRRPRLKRMQHSKYQMSSNQLFHPSHTSV